MPSPPEVRRHGRRVVGAVCLVITGLTVGCTTTPAPSPPQTQTSNVPATPGDTIPSPTPAQWAALSTLPDWSGVWTPNWTDQVAQVQSNPLPWKAEYGARVAHMIAEDVAGRPAGLFVNCLPEGMPSWMLINHNAIEFLFTPGRVTILGESDGNRLRRIYTDGRGHPDDPAPTFHGHSIGRWDGDVLVVDTVGIMPQALLAVSEAAGVPTNGDVHVVERLRLTEPDTLVDEIEVTAPHVLTAPWKTTREYFRQRSRQYEITESVCLQGHFTEDVDAHGDAVFVPTPQSSGGTPQFQSK